jgi:hypothetical protein
MMDLSKYHDPRFSLPAVRVKSNHPDHEQGFYVINESDFDEKVHELWEEPVAKDEAKADRAEAEPAEAAKPVARAEKLHLR